ncbi:MAG: hypothetical protein SCM96_07590 [Acidobacteriota bacterium]|nr:hypothetical protein [Acidobacteriota bacterium]
MKIIKHIAISGLVLALVLGTLPACKRKISGQPDPLGPSSVGVVLNITSTLNAIFAGNQRQSTTISAVLKKFDGTPIAGKTVYFQVGDELGNRLSVGFFDSNVAVASKVTDGGGNVSVTYYGPLSQEIADNVSVKEDIYIWASVSWEGAQSILASTPIQIVRDFTQLNLMVSANPNVIFAGRNREMSTITAVLLSPHHTPMGRKTIYFEIVDAEGARQDIGFFENNKAVAEKVTGNDGTVRIHYYGPLAAELMGVNQTINILATVAWEGKVIAQETTTIHIIADATNLSISIGAYPQVLYATNTRPQSEIKVTARYEGAPIANRRVYFTILSGPGFFAGNKQVAYVQTGPDGVASIVYYGPTKDEIAFDQMVTIRGHLETSYPDPYESGQTYAEIDLRIIREQ